jgi:hypothetical protein
MKISQASRFFVKVKVIGKFFFSWRDNPLVCLGLLLIHEDFSGF